MEDALAPSATDREDEDGRQPGAEESHRGQPRTVGDAQENHGGGGPGGGPGADTEDIGLGQGVAGHRLERGSPDGQDRSDPEPGQDPWGPVVPDQGVSDR